MTGRGGEPARRKRARRAPAPLAPVGTADVIHELCNRIHGMVMEIQLALDSEAELSARHRASLEAIGGRCRELAQLSRRLRDAQPGDAADRGRPV
jgi:hypothetical protein